MVTFKNTNNETVGELTVIAAYFRRKDESLSDFSKQCKILSPVDKTELAVGAAKEMGWTVEGTL